MRWWLPQGLTEEKCSLACSEDLAELIVGAPRLSPLKSKLNPVTEKETDCPHPPSTLQRGGNQHIGWVSCMDCHARWKVSRKDAKKSEAKKMPAPKMTPQTRGTSSQEPFNAVNFARQMEEKYAEMAHVHKDVMGQEMRMKRAGGGKTDARGVEVGSTSVSAPQPRDEGCKDGAEESRGCCGDQGAHVDGVCGDGHGKPIHGTQGLPRFRDVELCSEQEELARGDASHRGGPAGAGRLSGPEVGLSNTHQDCTGEEEVQVPVSEENWLRLKGDVAGQVERINQSGVFVVTEIYVEEGEEMVRIQEGEVEDEEKCLVRIAPSLKMRMEEECEEVKETALPRKEKKRLKKALVSLQKAEETYAVDVSEVFSPPRITKEAEKQGLVTGGAYDLKTGFDLSKEQDRGRMWQELEKDEPELVVGSPPCTAFSLLREFNYRVMDFEKAKTKVMDGLEHLDTTVDVCEWQDDNGRLFLFEHPKTSRAFKEERMVKLMQRAGVWVCYVDMCAYGMNVDGEGLNQKPTCWVTNSKKIALQLQRRCSRDHTHVNLMGGRGVKAAE